MTKWLLTAAVGKHMDPYLMYHERRIVDYARKWGFQYDPYFSVGDLSRHNPPDLYWAKMWVITEKMKKVPDGDLISWLDADICIVRGDIELTTTKSVGCTYDLNVPTDFRPILQQGPNVGLLAIRVNEFSRNFFDKIWNDTRFDTTNWPDNFAFSQAIFDLSKEDLEKHIELLPRTLNVTGGSTDIPREEIRFRHFAGEFGRWDQSFYRKPVEF